VSLLLLLLPVKLPLLGMRLLRDMRCPLPVLLGIADLLGGPCSSGERPPHFFSDSLLPSAGLTAPGPSSLTAHHLLCC